MASLLLGESYGCSALEWRENVVNNACFFTKNVYLSNHAWHDVRD